jgi:hypothetical protein
MRINELLVESQQHEQLDEGPFGQAVGKAVGGLAKGVGAVAGGVAGMGKAFKKGFSSGKATVAGDPDPNDDAAAAKPGAAPAPADDAVGGATAQPAAGDINKAGPAGTAAAKPLQGAAKIAADKTAAATAGQDQTAAGQTMYAQVKANIDKLDKKGKQRILQLLQKSIAAPAAGGAAPAAGKPAASASPGAAAAAMTGEPTAAAPGEEPAGAMGSMANQLGGKPANTMANAPVSKTNTAKPSNPNAAPAAEPQAAPAAEPAPAAGQPAPKRTGGKVKGQVSMTPNAVRKREKRLGKQQPQGPDQAEIDASRDRLMGNFSDSVERHKQRMVAESFARGEISLFRQR